VAALVCAAGLTAAAANRPAGATVLLRGRPQALHLYGARGGPPVLLSSGDGGWMHLAPRVAELLAARGYFVVGFDVWTYLQAFTSGPATLRMEDEPADYRTLIAFAAQGSAEKPVLIGVSEGAGLSVLAAAAPGTKPLLRGVIALGLPDVNELGWRWKDAMIYVTHGVPDEPTFRARDVVAGVAPLPLAAIHSTRDEFVPLAEARDVFGHAAQPARFWAVPARDHKFSGNPDAFEADLMEALAWIAHPPG
jgi:pimeloyl-ACP methyl ester carboxylesterase